MQQWTDIRRRVLVEGVSKRQILRETGMHWTTLEKILSHSSPPRYHCRRFEMSERIGQVHPSDVPGIDYLGPKRSAP